jgi:hypothetical protein
VEEKIQAERRVTESQTLLEDMLRAPDKLLEALTPEETREVMKELRTLSNQARMVRKGSELLALSTSLRRLVTRRRKLSKRFHVIKRRGGDWSDIDNLFSETEVLAYAYQIENSVEKLGQVIDEKLERLPKQSEDNDVRW